MIMTIILIRGVIIIIDITINSNINVILILIIMQSSNVSVWLTNSNSWRFHKTACTSFHPWKLTWITIMKVWFRWFSYCNWVIFRFQPFIFHCSTGGHQQRNLPQIWGLMWRIDLGQGTHSQGWWGEMQASLPVEFLGAVRSFFWPRGWQKPNKTTRCLRMLRFWSLELRIWICLNLHVDEKVMPLKLV